MDLNVQSQQQTRRRRKIFRKQVVLPAEHGSWSWLLVPYLTGLLAAGQWHVATLFVLTGGLAGFLLRQPMTVWARASTGRGRKADAVLAAGWAIAFGLIAVFSLFALLLLDRAELLWLLLPLLVVFVLYLGAARQKRASTRTLWMEIAGAMGLAAMAPAATIAALGRLDQMAWVVWGLMACQNGLGVLYVRLRIADTHNKEMNRHSIFWVHTAVLVLVAGGVLAGLAPWLVLLPFLGFLLRAAWTAAEPRPIPEIKRFGFTEIGVEVVGGLLVAAGFLVR